MEIISSSANGRRCVLTPAKAPLLEAVRRILGEQREHWPLTVREVHYRLLGSNAPLIHASKPGSRYVNDLDSYRACVDVCARGRLEGYIPWEAIEDETRPVQENGAFVNMGEFFKQETENFLSGYWRNLMQSQRNHIEIVTEKLTLQGIPGGIASEYTLPFSVLRGRSSLPPRHGIAERYRRSGKDRPVLLLVSDPDPADDTIAGSFAESMDRDFGIAKIDAFKVALTIDQVREFGLEPSMEAKKSSPTYRAFVERYGITTAYELEAMRPADLQQVLRDAVDQVIDREAFEAEKEIQQDDLRQIISLINRSERYFASLRNPNWWE
jgi:hypothetical protein